MIGPAAAADHLAKGARVFSALVEDLPDAQARWRPEPDRWSVLEVVNHLADEEVEDFRARFQRTLADPEAPWPPIDPRGWVEARAYRERDPAASLARFLAERASSVSMLRGLPACDLDVAYAHPSLGVQRAGDLLAAWLAHDLIHVRQINRLRYLWLEREAEPYRLGYAGPF